MYNNPKIISKHSTLLCKKSHYTTSKWQTCLAPPASTIVVKIMYYCNNASYLVSRVTRFSNLCMIQFKFAEMSSDTGSGDIIQKSLSELNKLRHEASKVFLTASEGVRDLAGEETGKEKKFLAGLKTQIDSVTSVLGSVEKSLSQPNSLPTAPLLGSLDSDSNVETFHLYSTLSK